MMGTGEGEGDNRALEAAERAIANPLLDGVSMTGAKGVIISIIGGEDMKLLEVDEAANHIRELVDPEANIIWGSAFNPALEGKIRVSVFATGIEQSAEQAYSASQPLNFAARAPKKPVLPPPTEEELAEDAGSEFTQPARFDDEYAEAEPEAESDATEAYGTARMPEPYQSGDGGDEEDEEGLAEPAEDGGYGEHGPGYASLTGTRIERDPEAVAGREEGDEWDEEEGGEGEALELTFEAEEGVESGESEGEPAPGGQDELLLDASRLAEADEPVQAGTPGRRRRMLGGGGDDSEPEAESAPPPQRRTPAAPPTGGSTLFERMANLSRASSGPSDDEEEEEGGGGLRIPRFLGRQNNQ
jgi:cell division protein FtsZ